MKYLRMTVPQEVVTSTSEVNEGYILNVQLLPDKTLLELVLVRATADEVHTILETSTTADDFSYEMVEIQDGKCYIYQHCRPTEQVRELLQILNEHRLMIVFPMEINEVDGVTIEVIGSESDVQTGFDALPEEVRHRASIKRVGKYSPVAASVVSVLTERQREILDAAVTVGYYDVADVAGCASSTASEHLRKIEARILTSLAGE